MRHLILSILVLLAACGGGGEQPIAQCNGTPKVAVVYAGAKSFPELATIADACVYSTSTQDPAEFAAVVQHAIDQAHTSRAYLIGVRTALPLQFREANPGQADMTSVWFAPAWPAVNIPNSLIPIYLNADQNGAAGCAALADSLTRQNTPAQCTVHATSDFGAAQRADAIAQLRLDLLR